MGITIENYFIGTFVIFKACKRPKRLPNYISYNSRNKKSSSKYWYGKDHKGFYVIRESSHWSGKECNMVGSCVWMLKESRGDNKLYKRKVGKAYITQFKPIRKRTLLLK